MNDLNNLDKLCLYFESLSNFGYSKFRNLVSSINGSKYDVILKLFINNQIEGAIFERDWEKLIQNKLNYIKKNNISYISFFSDIYPNYLKQLKHPPFGLYCKGNLNILLNLDKSISIVGSRKINNLGIKICKSFIKEFVEYDLVTISGLAFGIDRLVHEETLNLKGLTVAVLPCSPEFSTPKQNYDIYKKILENNGLIISEFGSTNLVPGLFPLRNRIIAGLSLSTLVVQAGQNSGSLITAKIAFEYGRNVYSIPYSLNEELGIGCNFIIKQNIAQLVTDPVDIINETYFKAKKSNKNIHNILVDEKAKSVYSVISKGQSSFDDLLYLTNIQNSTELLFILTDLEINNLIKKDQTGVYKIV